MFLSRCRINCLQLTLNCDLSLLCLLPLQDHYGSKPNRSHKSKFDSAIRELTLHISKLNEQFPGKFHYSPPKTAFDVRKLFLFGNESLTPVVEGANATLVVSENGNSSGSRTASNYDESNQSATQNPNWSITSNEQLNTSNASTPTNNTTSDCDMTTTTIANQNVQSKDQMSPPVNDQLADSNSANRPSARVGKRKVLETLRARKAARSDESNDSGIHHEAASPHSPLRAALMSPPALTTTTTNATSSTSSPLLGNALSSNSRQPPPLSVQQSIESQIVSLREENEKLQKQLEHCNRMHHENLKEMKHNSDLVLMEVRESWVDEKERAVREERKRAEVEKNLLIAKHDQEKDELLKQIVEIKKKQWCANCLKEANLYCCWNTSYCDYPCQREHWRQHLGSCQQVQNQNSTQQQNSPKKKP